MLCGVSLLAGYVIYRQGTSLNGQGHAGLSISNQQVKASEAQVYVCLWPVISRIWGVTRLFTNLRKPEIGFGSTFICREGIYTLTTPVKSVLLNQVLFFNVSLKSFQNMTFRINYLENFIHLPILIYFFVGQYVKIFIHPSH